MDLLTRLSRQTVRIGSSSACEVCIRGPDVPPVAAEVIHQGGGRLFFLPMEGGNCTVEGQPLEPGSGVPFDFQSQFSVAAVPIPITHPDLCLMVMSLGQLVTRGPELVVGRDPERCHLVMSSPGVSGKHASVYFGRAVEVVDHRSTSGTWLEGTRLPAEQNVVLRDDHVLALGPLPLPVHLARELHQLLSEQGRRGSFGTEAMPRQTAQVMRMRSQALALSSAPHRTVVGTVRMTQASFFTVGRTQDNDIVLNFPQISGRHARLICAGEELFLEDSGSDLGTSVRGTRLRPGQRARVIDGQRVLFGALPAFIQLKGDQVDIVVEDREGWAGKPLFEIAAAAISVVVPDRNQPSRTKTLLDNVSFKALPGDFIALMGPSGSGKTTLLHALTGYVRPKDGEVLINDAPLPDVFETLRGSMGYVPQDDIVHAELTVFEAVRYSARFRLPSDYDDDEIARRVHATLAQLGLESVAHLVIGTPAQKVLSGGQRKRVNIAMELVTDPVLLFLDEPTSGLAADDTTALIDLLARLATDYGKTIIATIHQPARDEYEKFNLALILGHGGIPLYFGPTQNAYAFFEGWRAPSEVRGIATPRDMFAELSERHARLASDMAGATMQEVREAVSAAYRREYCASAVAESMTTGARGIGGEGAQNFQGVQRERPRRQLRLLLSRYLKIKTRDRVGTAILLLQAPLIGALLSIVFGAQHKAVPYWCLGALNELAQRGGKLANIDPGTLSSLTRVSDHSVALFFLVVSAVWFGTSNAAREIVGERTIFRRERMINLGITNYVLSKFMVLGALSLLQCAVLLAIVFVTLGFQGGSAAFALVLATMTLTALCSVALGLLLSAAVATGEAAMALTPIALIPQVILGGIMVPVTTNPWLKIPMLLTPSRWGFEGVVRPEREAVSAQPGWMVQLEAVPDSPPDFIRQGAFECALAQMESTTLSGAWGFTGDPYVPHAVLFGMTVVLLGLVGTALLRGDARW